jgi:hypothetical protein
VTPQASQEIVATDVLTAGVPGTQATGTAAQVVASRDSRVRIDIANNGAAAVFIGKTAAITTSTGFPIQPNGVFTDRDYTGAIFAIVATGTADLRIWDVG